MADEEITQIPGERAETSAGRRLDNNPVLKRGIVALAIVVFVAFALWSMRGQEKRSDGTQPERVIIRQTSDFEPAKEPVQPVKAPTEVQLPTPVMTERAATDTDKLLDAARRAPVIAYGGEKSPATRRRDSDPTTDQLSNYVSPGINPGSFQSQGENEDQRFNRMLAPTQLQGSLAGTLGNRDFIVAMGTSVPCVLETALSSDQPGFTSCVINRDVLSDNGRVVLMEKGTQVVGEYRGGLIHYASDGSPIRPERVMAELQPWLERGIAIVADASYSSMWILGQLRSPKAGLRFITPRGLAGLGWGFPLALGAKAAQPDRPVVAVVGDGGFAHSWAELETMMRMRLPVTVVVLNNGVLGFQRDAETVKFGQYTSACHFADVDHAAIASACGCPSVRIDDPASLGPALKRGIEAGEPLLIEVMTDSQAHPPLSLFAQMDEAA
ncbi:thiamine pyrophosphate-dependent enzyme [Rhizobium sp. WW_1]|jgi:hypothetical protein|uniref:thiamine pyrophosphate-dependent enzyme n=1 Tax=Rhizobium sp. WW_1 TaxID=1907375 RepID=UPI0009DD41DE|nr:thiamine pyrophosphate-dependent enzyme [Rhizobium sp. WW_1]RKD52202.1 conjugative transfer protein TrbI [Rhizobium sp. WW_1]